MGSLIKATNPSRPTSMQPCSVIAQKPSRHLKIRAVGAGKPPMGSLIKANKATSMQTPGVIAQQPS